MILHRTARRKSSLTRSIKSRMSGWRGALLLLQGWASLAVIGVLTNMRKWFGISSQFHCRHRRRMGSRIRLGHLNRMQMIVCCAKFSSYWYIELLIGRLTDEDKMNQYNFPRVLQHCSLVRWFDLEKQKFCRRLKAKLKESKQVQPERCLLRLKIIRERNWHVPLNSKRHVFAERGNPQPQIPSKFLTHSRRVTTKLLAQRPRGQKAISHCQRLCLLFTSSSPTTLPSFRPQTPPERELRNDRTRKRPSFRRRRDRLTRSYF